MELEDLKVYNMAMALGEKVWSIVDTWDYFQKDTIGKQLVKATDSIAANLSEGFGRYHFKEAKNFGYYSRGSLYETKTWLNKAFHRKLIQEVEFHNLRQELDVLVKMLNGYIRSIGQVSEPDTGYSIKHADFTTDY